jgi:hypothetical protein
MPRKKQGVRREYRRAGFNERTGKGDHTICKHPLVRRNYSVDGADGKDALPYGEKLPDEVLRALAAAPRRLQP